MTYSRMFSFKTYVVFIPHFFYSFFQEAMNITTFTLLRKKKKRKNEL